MALRGSGGLHVIFAGVFRAIPNAAAVDRYRLQKWLPQASGEVCPFLLVINGKKFSVGNCNRRNALIYKGASEILLGKLIERLNF